MSHRDSETDTEASKKTIRQSDWQAKRQTDKTGTRTTGGNVAQLFLHTFVGGETPRTAHHVARVTTVVVATR